MITDQQRDRARIFQELHKNGKTLILPNVWNALSAKIFENEGFKAIATSSAGIAFGLASPDGERIPLESLLEITKQIIAKIKIPLSVDFEAGYGNSKAEVKANARRLLELGCVGLNIEDGKADGSLLELDQQVEKIRGLVELKEELNLDFVINARTCAYWLSLGSEEEMFEIAKERGRAFLEAGADCVFVPGQMTKSTIAKLLAAIPGPLNIIFTPQTSDFASLRKMGVNRLSLGSSPVRSVLAHITQIAQELKRDDSKTMTTITTDYRVANEIFK